MLFFEISKVYQTNGKGAWRPSRKETLSLVQTEEELEQICSSFSKLYRTKISPVEGRYTLPGGRREITIKRREVNFS